MKYAMIDQLRNRHPVSRLCTVLDIAKSGYQAWRSGKVVRHTSLTVAQTGRGTVWGFDQYGEPALRVLSPTSGSSTTNLVCGGGDMKTLFITESNTGQILAADMPVAGNLLFSHQ
jgi:hypothetical protein